jgi:hypothetical protein
MTWPSLGVPESWYPIASQRRDSIVRSGLTTATYDSKTIAGLQRKSSKKTKDFSEARLIEKIWK